MTDLNSEISCFTSHFKEQVNVIYSATFAPRQGRLYKKALFVLLIDALSKTYPKKNNRDGFVALITEFSDWKNSTRVSLPHLWEFLKKYNNKDFAPLKGYCIEKIKEWKPGNIITLDKEPDISEINKLWPIEKEKIKIDDAWISAESFTHAHLLYSNRNVMVHELRESGYGMESKHVDEPHYHSMQKYDSKKFTWELVYSVNFFKSISENIIQNLEQYYKDNKINPYSYYNFGTYWIEELNIDDAKFKKASFSAELNSLIQTTIARLDIKYIDQRLAAIAALFIKAAKTFKACSVLFKNGCFEDGEVLTRILYEEMLKLGYCSIGDNEFNQFLASDLTQSIKAINVIAANQDEAPDDFFKMLGNKSLEELKKDKEDCLAKLGANEVKIEAMARRIDKETPGENHCMMKLYNAYYRSVCNGVHTNPNSITPFMVFKDDGSISLNLNFKTDKDGPETAAIDFMLLTLKFISGVFGFPSDGEIEHLNSIKIVN